jgi:hypothetical protein
MANHTAAPWTVVTDHDTVNGQYAWEIEVQGGMDIVCAMDMAGDLMPGDVERTDADFALIASAPDLLAACEGAAELLGMLCYANNWATETDGALAAAMHTELLGVIEKAKGEPA